MENVIKDILLIQSLNLDKLIEDYRVFFLSIIPSMFVLAALLEYFDRMDTFSLVKRAVVSILILSTVTSFYKATIDASMEAANEKLGDQKHSNILLMDMFGALTSWDSFNSGKSEHNFNKDNNYFYGALNFLKYHLFDRFINDGFTIVVYFICKICFVILKVVYSLVYYLGFGLIGIPCLVYLFPTMGNVLRGAILSYVWCLVVPHVLVFILSLIGSEINKGYVTGNIIGGSAIGTALLFVMSLFLAFTPLITAMILNGSGISQAGGIIATMGANFVMNLPRNSFESAATIMTGAKLGPKMTLAKNVLDAGKSAGVKARGMLGNSVAGLKNSVIPPKKENIKSTEDVSKFAQSLISQYLETSSSKSSSGILKSSSSAALSSSHSSLMKSVPDQGVKSSPKFSLDQSFNQNSKQESIKQSSREQNSSQAMRKQTLSPKINMGKKVEVKREQVSRPVSRNTKNKNTH